METVIPAAPAFTVETIDTAAQSLDFGKCFDPGLNMLAAMVSDTEAIRKSTQNRLRQLLRDEPDVDGVFRGFALPMQHPIVVTTQQILLAQLKAEEFAIKELEKRMAKHPLGPWIAKTPGVGKKQGARLLSAIGDPYWHVKSQRSRTVSELWSYAGYSTCPVEPDSELASKGVLSVAVRRKKGVRANWSTEAKTRAYLVAESCIKQVGSEKRARSPFRDVYEERRAHTKATHPEWSDGHSHNDALRITAKEILKALWREARTVHEEEVEPVA